MNEANQLLKGTKNVFSVIGDGAMTAGLAFEGLMHAGHLGRDLNIILNDNDMSISKNKGGLSDYLAKAHNSAYPEKTFHLICGWFPPPNLKVFQIPWL